MRPRTFIALAAATLVAVVAAAAAVNRNQGAQPPAGIGQPVFPGLIDRVNDVDRMVVDFGEGTVTLRHGQAGWTVKESDDYPARAPLVRQAILGVAQLKYFEPKTAKPENLAKLDLQDPAVKDARSKRVTLFDRDGRPMADVIVGRRRQSLPGSPLGGMYIRKPGEAQTWLAAGSPDVSDEKHDWLERKIVDIDDKRVKRVVVRHPDGETVVVSKAKPGDENFTLANIPAGKQPISPAGINYVGGALKALLLDEAKKATEAFDAASTVTADVTTFDGLALQVLIAERDGKSWMRLDASPVADAPPRKEGPSAAEEAKQIVARVNGWTYRLSAYAASNLTKRMSNLVEDKKKKKEKP